MTKVNLLNKYSLSQLNGIDLKKMRQHEFFTHNRLYVICCVNFDSRCHIFYDITPDNIGFYLCSTHNISKARMICRNHAFRENEYNKYLCNMDYDLKYGKTNYKRYQH